jgi:hypothetical protein
VRAGESHDWTHDTFLEDATAIRIEVYDFGIVQLGEGGGKESHSNFLRESREVLQASLGGSGI